MSFPKPIISVVTPTYNREDELIQRLARKYNCYGLEKNKGYGTEIHRTNLIKEGATKLHRKSFISRLEKN